MLDNTKVSSPIILIRYGARILLGLKLSTNEVILFEYRNYVYFIFINGQVPVDKILVNIKDKK